MQFIAVVTEDPVIGFAVRRAMLNEMHVETIQGYGDTACYSRKLPSDWASEEVLFEGAHLTAKMGAKYALFPDRFGSEELRNLQAEGKIVHSIPVKCFEGLPIVESAQLAGIRQNIMTETPPEDATQLKNYSHVMGLCKAWAKVALAVAAQKKEPKILSFDSILDPHKLLSKVTHPDRFDNRGFVGLVGGLGPRSSADAGVLLGETHGCAVIEYSACTLPNLADPIIQLYKELPTVAELLDVPKIIEKVARAAIIVEETGADACAIMCNTAHHFRNLIKMHGAAVGPKWVNIVHETIEEARKNGHKGILVLGTTALNVGSVYTVAADQIGVNGLELIKPGIDGGIDRQQVVDNVIWRYLMLAGIDRHGRDVKQRFGIAVKALREQVVEPCMRDAAGNLRDGIGIVAACTELGPALRAISPNVLDSLEIACVALCRVAERAREARDPALDLSGILNTIPARHSTSGGAGGLPGIG